MKLGTMEGASLYGFEARLEGESIFVLSTIYNLYLKDKDLITAEFKKGKIDTVKKDIIQFSKDIFCIYVKKLDLLLVLNSPQTIMALRFKDQYKTKARDIIRDEWGVVDVPTGSWNKVLDNNQYNQLLIKMHVGRRLRDDIYHYQRYNGFCDEHPELELEPLVINNGRVVITESRHLEFALHVSDNTIVEGVLNRGDYSLALRRKPLSRRNDRG